MTHNVLAVHIHYFYQVINPVQFLIILSNRICHNIHSCDTVTAAHHALNLCTFQTNWMEFINNPFLFQFFEASKWSNIPGLQYTKSLTTTLCFSNLGLKSGF